jgi:molybdate transport system ATP-binding protein
MDINPFEVTANRRQAERAFERRRRKAVERLHLAPFLKQPLLSLSNGERQRVELARALCHPLRLLILDEPFAGLDVAARHDFRQVLEALMKTPLRVLLITTRLEDLPRGITHVMRVDRCRVAAAGRKSGNRTPKSERSPKSELRARFAWRHPGPAFGDRTSAFLRTSGFGFGARPPLPCPGAAPGPELVRLQDVTVRYGARTILRNLTWSVRAGESWVLLGPNGSGKTTLLSLLIGDNPQAYANQVFVFGRQRGSGESIWELKRRIGWVSPELHLHFNDTVTCFEVVASAFHGTIGLFEPATPKQRAAARRWLGRFGLLEFAATPLFALSAGLQRMVLLARALATNPPLLLLDEPCQGLDAAHRRLFVQTVDALIGAGAATVIYVTHRSDEIPMTIRRVLHLRTSRTGPGRSSGGSGSRRLRQAS